jgi:hybrid polyketide synthase / nonribosomal peptide synthetase ACE1
MLTSTEATLKQIWGEVLRRDVAAFFNITQETDFFNARGNSLLLMRLQSLIRETFFVSLTLIRLFYASTLGSMALLINNISLTIGTRIDWQIETEPSVDLLTIEHHSNVDKLAHEPKVVALTGSTGYLGRVILRLLVEIPKVGEVHCVAVRGNPPARTR